MKKYYITIFVLGILTVFNLQAHKENDTRAYSLASMEAYLDVDKISSLSDICVEGKVVDRVETVQYNSGEVSIPISVYSFQVENTLAGNTSDEMVYFIYGGDVLPKEFSEGGKYVLFLTENSLAGYDKVYSFVSLQQGIFEKREDGYKNTLNEDLKSYLN